MPEESLGSGWLSAAQLNNYRQHASRRLTQTNYNLFAEITLRVLESHDAQARELERLKRLLAVQADSALETELLARENEALHRRIHELEGELQRLSDLLQAQEMELAALKRQDLKLPPSWRAR